MNAAGFFLCICAVCGDRFSTEAALEQHDKAKHRIGRGLHRFAVAHERTCYWCGEEVPLNVPRDDPRAPTREHLTPKALNGKNATVNLVLAHRRCNHLRQYKDADAFLRLMRGDAVTKFDLWPHLFAAGK